MLSSWRLAPIVLSILPRHGTKLPFLANHSLTVPQQRLPREDVLDPVCDAQGHVEDDRKKLHDVRLGWHGNRHRLHHARHADDELDIEERDVGVEVIGLRDDDAPHVCDFIEATCKGGR
jgi:hypothetical protein